MEGKREEEEPTIIMYECVECQLLFPHTQEETNKCPNCGQPLKKV